MTINAIMRELHTVRDYLRWAVTRFEQSDIYYGHGTDNALDEAMQLVMSSLSIPMGAEQILLDGKLLDAEKEQLIALVETRCDLRLPVPYLLNEAYFAGLKFYVDERVLIPRSPIAELIQQGFEPWMGHRLVHRVLDLCAGCGCIGIACAMVFQEAHVELSDLSDDALAVAQYNIENHELEHRVRTIHSDVFENITGQFDLIVSNPPYVDADDLADMPAEYHHEPALALGCGSDGLDLARKILAQAADYLTTDGLLVLEVGNSCIALEQAYPEVPFTWVDFERGGHGVLVFSRDELKQYF